MTKEGWVTRVEWDENGNVIVDGEELSDQEAEDIKEKLREQREADAHLREGEKK